MDVTCVFIKNEHACKSKCKPKTEFGNAVSGAKEAVGGLYNVPGASWGKGPVLPSTALPEPLVPADRNILALELGFDSMGEVQMTHFQLLFT